MTDRLVSAVVVSQMTGVNTKTLTTWRATGIGPGWQKVGPKLVRYPLSGVETWIRDQATQRTA
jgi:predicted DNA-binding transcriptional regulator AlpA